MSLVTFLTYSHDMHIELIEGNGLELLKFFLLKKDCFLTYLVCKCFVILSRIE